MPVKSKAKPLIKTSHLGMYGDFVPTFCRSLAHMDTVNVGSCSRLMGVDHTFPACLHWASGLACRGQLLPL